MLNQTDWRQTSQGKVKRKVLTSGKVPFSLSSLIPLPLQSICLTRFRMDFENTLKKIEREVVFYTDRCMDSYTSTFPQLTSCFLSSLRHWPTTLTGKGMIWHDFFCIPLPSFFHSLLNLQHQLILLKDLPHRFSQSTSESPSLNWAIIRNTSGCALSLLSISMLSLWDWNMSLCLTHGIGHLSLARIAKRI